MIDKNVFYKKALYKKIKSIFVFGLLLQACMGHTASLWLETDNVSLQADEEFDVRVKLDASNTQNDNIVLVDAVLQFDTEMLELVTVSTDSANSNFFYNYTLSTNDFPIINQSVGLVNSTAQFVVGVPSSQAVLEGESNAQVAILRFRAKQPPATRLGDAYDINFVYSDGNDYSQSKVIADDGLGTNVLTSVTGLSLSSATPVNIPLPFTSMLVLAACFIAIVFAVLKFVPGSAAKTLVSLVALLVPLAVSVSSKGQGAIYDLTGDGEVDSQDIGVLLSYWGGSHANSDLDSSGTVNEDDLDILLGQHNPATAVPPPVARSVSNSIVNSYTYFDTEKTRLQTEIVNGPRTDLDGIDDITTTVYNTQGNVHTITNALGYVTTMQNYNGRGQAQEIIDANGVITTLSYHPRGWLTSRTVKHPVDTNLDAITTFGYDAVGQVIQITLPDNSFLKYEYDDARRLVAIENTLAERIEYTLDNAGNRTAEVICSANTGGDTGVACGIEKTQTRIFDALSRLRKDIGAQSQEFRYDYDSNDNLEISTDAKTQATLQSFDSLNRLQEQVDPDATAGDDSDNPKVQYTYDTQDRIKTVTDQRGLVTTYNYDAFGSMTSVDSPDTGLTTYTYDDAGNRTSKTDARGQVVYYRYDALNRLTDVVALNAPQENVVYVYDDTSMSSYGVGRLSHIYDESGKTTFIYDHRGNVQQKLVEIDGVAYSTQYSYSLADRLMSMTYPSGRQITYQRDADGRISSVSENTNSVTSGISYKAFGPVASYTLGNGINRAMTYDLDYRLTDIVDTGTGSALDLDYGYDLNSNIDTWDDALNAVNDQSFTYDELDRLDTASGVYGSIDYDYDGVGNRTQKVHTENSVTTTDMYIYPVDSNRLDRIDSDDGSGVQSRNFIYDAVGNTVSDDQFGAFLYGLGYNAMNRFVDFQADGAPVAQYQHNALGQRVVKVLGGNTIHYHYDESGQLLALSDGSGQVIKEYIYVDSMRVARVVDNVGSPVTEYFHNDHLGRPLALTDAAQTVVWKADYLPFGEARVVVNTTSDQELGFPGQVLDSESGFWYNYFRDYDASTGRYLQGDPIGITRDASSPIFTLLHVNILRFIIGDTAGFKLNHLFSYVDSSPQNYYDPFGLYMGQFNVYRPQNAFRQYLPENSDGNECVQCILDAVIPGVDDAAVGLFKKLGSLAKDFAKKYTQIDTIYQVSKCLGTTCKDCD